MPRIEIIPVEGVRPHDGSPTVDLCRTCAKGLTEGESLTESDLAAFRVNGIPFKPGAKYGSVDVAHPPYEDEFIDCDACGSELTQCDNDNS